MPDNSLNQSPAYITFYDCIFNGSVQLKFDAYTIANTNTASFFRCIFNNSVSTPPDYVFLLGQSWPQDFVNKATIDENGFYSDLSNTSSYIIFKDCTGVPSNSVHYTSYNVLSDTTISNLQTKNNCISNITAYINCSLELTSNNLSYYADYRNNNDLENCIGFLPIQYTTPTLIKLSAGTHTAPQGYNYSIRNKNFSIIGEDCALFSHVSLISSIFNIATAYVDTKNISISNIKFASNVVFGSNVSGYPHHQYGHIFNNCYFNAITFPTNVGNTTNYVGNITFYDCIFASAFTINAGNATAAYTNTISFVRCIFTSTGTNITNNLATRYSNYLVFENCTGINVNSAFYTSKGINTNNAITPTATLNANTIIKIGGSASQFLKADGTVDSSTYLTSATLAAQLTSYGVISTYPSFSMTCNSTNPLTVISGFIARKCTTSGGIGFVYLSIPAFGITLLQIILLYILPAVLSPLDTGRQIL